MQIIRAAATDTVKGNAAYEIHEKRKETGRQRSDRHDPEKAGTLSEEASLQRGRYGLAVDVGTTTVVMELYELISGQRLSGLSRRNSQTLLGADVMMRLMHCQRGQQAKLEKLIRQQLEEMASRSRLNGSWQSATQRCVISFWGRIRQGCLAVRFARHTVVYSGAREVSLA